MARPTKSTKSPDGEEKDALEDAQLEITSLRDFLLNHFDSSDIDDILPPHSGLDELAHLEALALPEEADRDTEDDEGEEEEEGEGEGGSKEDDVLFAPSGSPKVSRKRLTKIILGGLERLQSEGDTERINWIKSTLKRRKKTSRPSAALSKTTTGVEQRNKLFSPSNPTLFVTPSSPPSYAPQSSSSQPVSLTASMEMDIMTQQMAMDQMRAIASSKNRSQSVTSDTSSPPSSSTQGPALRKFLTPSNRIILSNFSVNIRSQLECVSSQNLNEDPFILSLWSMTGS